MATFQLPLQNIPQTFQMTLGAVEYTITCRWNDADQGGWCLDFVDAVTGASIVANIPLVCGVDLLDGLDYLGFTGALVVYTDGNPLAPPTLANLGVESNLYFITEDA